MVHSPQAAHTHREADDSVLVQDLQWVAQWLALLHRDGFPETLADIEAARRGDRAADEVAEIVVARTRHLAHPSLDALRSKVA